MNRIDSLIKYIDRGACVCDVGTDHGILPILLIERCISDKVVATDISADSLQKLRDKIAENNYKITTYVTDGLKDISELVDNIVIAGMGGDTIVGILERDLEIAKKAKLILSPHNATDKVRQFLVKNDFDILKEDLVFENGKYYEIIIAESNENPVEYCKSSNQKKESILEYGNLNNHENLELLEKKISSEVEILENILESLKGNSQRVIDRKEELKVKISYLEEIKIDVRSRM